MKLKIPLFVGALSTVAGLLLIAGAVLTPPLAHSDEAPFSGGDPGAGAKAWVENCTRCHNARDPREFRDDLWAPIVAHMRVRAGLTGKEARDILAYLQSSN